MAVLSALRRFARLGFWVGLGAGAMLIDACGGGQWREEQNLAADGAAPAVPKKDAAAAPDAGSDAPVLHLQAIDADQAQPTDGGKTDLWDTICE